MTCIVVLHFAGCFSADHLHENGAVIGIQDGAEDDSRKHWTVCSQPEQISRTELWFSCKNGENEERPQHWSAVIQVEETD